MSPDKTRVYQEMLEAAFPDLVINTIKILDTGWHHDAAEVNGSIIFLIPHHTYGHAITPERVHREVELLKFLKDKVPVQIPDPQYVAADESYFGYPKLNGVLLNDILETFSQDDWEQFKVDWVAIANSLHKNVTIEMARSLKVPEFEPPSSDTAKRIFDIPGVDEDVLNFAREVIKQLEAYDPDPSSYVFLHYDMQSRNILANPETKRITGLIDWTDSLVGPRSREFSVHEWMQGDLLNEAAALYEQKAGVHVDVKQARMWYSIDELSAYVEYIKAEDFDEAAKYLQRIKDLIAAGR
jgi:aminoglycoside phosphotransferase (APT) family kinase protein